MLEVWDNPRIRGINRCPVASTFQVHRRMRWCVSSLDKIAIQQKHTAAVQVSDISDKQMRWWCVLNSDAIMAFVRRWVQFLPGFGLRGWIAAFMVKLAVETELLPRWPGERPLRTPASEGGVVRAAAPASGVVSSATTRCGIRLSVAVRSGRTAQINVWRKAVIFRKVPVDLLISS